MKRSRFTEEQIIAVLREQEAGLSTAEVCRKHGISAATFYAWKAKLGGTDVSETPRSFDPQLVFEQQAVSHNRISNDHAPLLLLIFGEQIDSSVLTERALR